MKKFDHMVTEKKEYAGMARLLNLPVEFLRSSFQNEVEPSALSFYFKISFLVFESFSGIKNKF